MQRFWHRKRWNIAITGHFPQQQFSPRLEFRVKKVPQKRFLYATCTHIILQTRLFGGKFPNRKSITNASHTVKKSHFASSVSWSPCWKIVAKKVTDNQPIESYDFGIFIGTWIDFTFLTNRENVPHNSTKSPFKNGTHVTITAKTWFSSQQLHRWSTWTISSKVTIPFLMLFHLNQVSWKTHHNWSQSKAVSSSPFFSANCPFFSIMYDTIH